MSFFQVCPVYAQDSPGIEVTSVYPVADQSAVEGDIVINSETGIVLTKTAYENRMFGVVQDQPLIVFRNVDGTGTPIIRSGNALVNVTTVNGPIKQGDLVTSSAIAGKGQKADKSGYVLGTALEDFTGETGSSVTLDNKQYKQGKIQIALRIEFAEIDRARSSNRLVEYIDAALFSTVKDPDQVIRIVRYTGAVLVIMATAVFAYLVFARTISNGIQAIGRNPLARRSIQVAIILNIIFSAMVIILGIIASFVLLRA